MRERSVFVGRDGERAVLADALQDPGCDAAFVVGPAGVGKTRLLRETADLTRSQGWDVKWVTASPTSASIPFGAVVQALPALDGADGFQVLREATRRIDEAAARGPVAIFIDDAPYLDEASAAVAVHIALLGRAVVVTSWRSSGTGEGGPGVSWRDVSARRIDLAALSLAETRQLIDSLLDGPVDEPTLTRLHRASQGNPLFVTELVAGGLREGRLRRNGAYWQWNGRFAFTPRLRDVIGGRLGGVSEPVRTIIDLLAYGGPLLTPTLHELGAGIADLLDAERSGLIRSAPTERGIMVELAHPLFAELAHSRTTFLARRELARRLYATVEAGHEVDPLRSASWLLDSGVTTAAPVLTAAARRAFAAFDPRLGLRLARAAVERGDQSARGVLAELLTDSGDCWEADELLAAMIAEIPAMGASAEHAHLFAQRAWNLAHGLGDEAGAEAVLQAGEAAVPDQGDVIAACRAHLGAYAGLPASALAQVDRVLGDGSAHPVSVIQAWLARSFALIVAGRLDEAIEAGEAGSAKYLELLGQTWSLLEEERSGGLAITRIFAGHLDDAEAICRRRIELTTMAAWTPGLSVWSVMMATVELFRGDAAASAERLRAVESLEGGAPHPYAPWTRQLHAAIYTLACAQLGRADEATRMLARTPEPPPWIGASAQWAGSPRAWVLAARGLTLQATHAAIADAERASAAGRHGWAVIALHQGVRFGHAPLVAVRLAALEGLVSGSLPELYLAHADAAGRRDPARLVAVATGYGRLGMRLHQAEALAQAASAYESAGQDRAGAAARQQARTLAHTCPSVRTPLLETLDDTPTLTAREHEIARLAWSGLSSRQIAEKLVISVRTVDNTLGHAYSKLGVDGRGGLDTVFGTRDETAARR